MAKSLKKNYLYSLTYQILTLITPFVTTPYVSRVLGAEGIGVASYVSAVVFYFTLIAALGTATIGQRAVAYNRDDIEKRSVAFWNAEILNFCTVCLASLIYFIFITWQTDNQVYYRILLLNIVTVALDVVWFFQGMEEFQKIVIRNIIFKFIGIGYLFLFVKTSGDVDVYLLGNALTALISAVSLWGYLPHYIKKLNWDSIKLKNTFRESILLFIPTLAISVYVVLDKIMLGWYTTDYAQNGYYEQAMKIAKMSLLPVMSLASVMTPRISYCFQKRDWGSMQGYMYKSVRILWLISCPICFGLWAVSADFVPWFFGEEFTEVTDLIYILALLIPIQGMTIIMGGQFLVSIKQERYFTYSVLVGATVNIILNYILIPKLLATGASVASIVGEIGVVSVQLYYVSKYLHIRRFFQMSFTYLLAAVMMAIVIMLEREFVCWGAMNILLYIITGGIIYLGSLLFTGDEIVRPYVEKIIIRLNCI